MGMMSRRGVVVRCVMPFDIGTWPSTLGLPAALELAELIVDGAQLPLVRAAKRIAHLAACRAAHMTVAMRAA